MIPDETVEQVREAADIVQIIGEYVNLKRTGTDYRGPCPFHQGKHRNFSVSPRKRIYYCFVCHEGGDVFHFLQKRLGMEWPAAVKTVAEKTGIEVREVDTRRDGPDPREPFWAMNAAASDFFARMLWDDPAGEQARQYLESRGLDRETAQRFGLGFSPRDGAAFVDHLRALGYDDEALAEGGLMVRPEDGSAARARFRGRLMIPIFDFGGHGIGFGGRVIGAGEPKYLNSPETPVFSKGKVLYGLNWARNNIRREDRVLVVEGYFDVIRLMMAGVETVVAPMGTALTDAQALALRRYTRNAYLLYDSDRAGLKATFRSGDELLAQGVSVRVVTFPDGQDPDSFVAAHGAAGLEAHLAQSLDVFDRKIQLLERAGWFGELQKKRRALDRLLPTIRATSDPIMRDLYTARAAEVTGVDRAILLRELGAASADRRAQRVSPDPEQSDRDDETRRPGGSAPSRIRPVPAPRDEGPRFSAERDLLRSMLQLRSRVEMIAERIDADIFRDPLYREIYDSLLSHAEDAPIDELAAAVSDEAAVEMQSLFNDSASIVNPERTVDDSLTAIRTREIEERLAGIDRIIPLASDAEKDTLIEEKRQLIGEIRGLGRISYKGFRGRKMTHTNRRLDER